MAAGDAGGHVTRTKDRQLQQEARYMLGAHSSARHAGTPPKTRTATCNDKGSTQLSQACRLSSVACTPQPYSTAQQAQVGQQYAQTKHRSVHGGLAPPRDSALHRDAVGFQVRQYSTHTCTYVCCRAGPSVKTSTCPASLWGIGAIIRVQLHAWAWCMQHMLQQLMQRQRKRNDRTTTGCILHS